MIAQFKFLGLSLICIALCVSCAHPRSTQATRRVYFLSPLDGAVLSSPVAMKFGVEGMTVHPAGVDVGNASAGHFHVLIDNTQGFVEDGTMIPFNDGVIHYGQGQSEGRVELSPGMHSLTLQFADGAHVSYGNTLASTIEIMVE